MKENLAARSIQIIGYIEVIAAFILGIVSDMDDIFGIEPFSFLMTCAVINCIIFEGFAEIIDLLYKNGKKKDTIIELLKDINAKSNKTPTSTEQDIEMNLPEM